MTGYCIRFKTLKDINIEILEAAIRYGFEDFGMKEAPEEISFSRGRSSFRPTLVFSAAIRLASGTYSPREKGYEYGIQI